MLSKSTVLISGVFILLYNNVLYSESYKIIWENEVEIDTDEIDNELDSTDEERMANWLLIYPGTKWCGAGNIAANESDLGNQRDTDKCCRTHDMCPDIIEGHQTKHGLENPSFYTRLSCSCDKDFYKCLKSVRTRTSKQIGHIYFTGLGTQCFKKEYPIAGCNRYISFPRRKCIEYIYNKGLPKKYQWFDIPNF